MDKIISTILDLVSKHQAIAIGFAIIACIFYIIAIKRASDLDKELMSQISKATLWLVRLFMSIIFYWFEILVVLPIFHQESIAFWLQTLPIAALMGLVVGVISHLIRERFRSLRFYIIDDQQNKWYIESTTGMKKARTVTLRHDRGQKDYERKVKKLADIWGKIIYVDNEKDINIIWCRRIAPWIRSTCRQGWNTLQTIFWRSQNGVALVVLNTDVLTAGSDNVITLSVLNPNGKVERRLSGEYDVTIYGIEQAADGTYGMLNGITLTSESQMIRLNFTKGAARLNLCLNKIACQTLGFRIVTVSGTSSLNVVH